MHSNKTISFEPWLGSLLDFLMFIFFLKSRQKTKFTFLKTTRIYQLCSLYLEINSHIYRYKVNLGNENRFKTQKRTQTLHRRAWLWSHFEFHTDLIQTIQIILINDFPWYRGRWYHHTYQWRFLNHADYFIREVVCQNKCGR